MKKVVVVLLLFGFVFGFLYGVDYVVEVKIKVKVYKNCKELNKVYKGGVVCMLKVKNKGGKIKYKFYVFKDFYDVNKKKDCDKDLIVCEW